MSIYVVIRYYIVYHFAHVIWNYILNIGEALIKNLIW